MNLKNKQAYSTQLHEAEYRDEEISYMLFDALSAAHYEFDEWDEYNEQVEMLVGTVRNMKSPMTRQRRISSTKISTGCAKRKVCSGTKNSRDKAMSRKFMPPGLTRLSKRPANC